MEDKLGAVYLNEAFDLLCDLEAASLTLEKVPEDEMAIAKVFRVMHTLKGSSNMFGYNIIGDLTHNLEHIYDQIREGKRKLDNKTLNVTLASIDLIRELLKDKDCEDEGNIQHLKEVKETIEEISGSEKPKSKAKKATGEEANLKTYYILFRPKPDLLKFGSNPLFILDDLRDLGNCRVTLHNKLVPTLEEIQTDVCYLYWEIHLSTDCSEDDIRGTFLFVEDLAEIEIHKVADQDLLLHDEFVTTIQTKQKKQEDINIIELQEYVNKLLQIIRDQSLQKLKSKTKTAESRISSLRVDGKKLDLMMNLVSELVTTQARLSLYASENDSSTLTGIAEGIEKISRQLRETTFGMRLIPIQSLETRFARLIRDLSASLNKNVNFNTEGMDTELDKSIIESLTDPILHILRNCLDHGIETPEERKKAGKPAEGNIDFKAYYSGASVLVEITDDGRGIDKNAVLAKAKKAGIVEDESLLTDNDIYKLIFHPGLSTARQVTDVSGRGVGMNVVKENVDKLRGEIDIKSTFGKGTTIIVTLPLTLSIIDGLMVEVNGQVYLLPQTSISKIHAAPYKDFKNKYNDFFVEGTRQMPFVDLVKAFNKNEADVNGMVHIIETRYQHQDLGIVVDKVLGEKQAVLKPLGKHYSKQDQFSGATILGDGTVALVIDTNKLVGHYISTKNLN